MLIVRQPDCMSPAIIPTIPPIGPDGATFPSNQAAPSGSGVSHAVSDESADHGSANGAADRSTTAAARSNGSPATDRSAATNGSAASNGGAVSNELIEKLAVRIAAAEERESIAELVRHAGLARPSGALMVAAIDGRLLAAVSLSTGEVVNEPTPAGEAAAAVVRYRSSRLGRPGGPVAAR